MQAVLDAVGRAGMAPVDMRYFAARDGQPADYCRQRVRECEIYVAVVGFRYGTVVPGEAVSYTELEFTEASAAGRPRLVFLLADAALGPAAPAASAAPADADRAAVAGFRRRLRDSGVVVRGFASDASLELEVFHALTEAGRSLVQAPTSAAMAVRYSLPPDTAAFTGRDEEIGSITAAVMAGGGAAIHAIGGMPGVGKTALAVRIAHALRGQFPDRQLFVDLHGHTPGQEPALPETVLAGLLTVVGVDARGLPADLESRASLWRDRMAGQRAVLVLDNAASSHQVTPLLPGGNDCLVLVTSRRHLGDLPGAATSVLLDVLPPGPAQDMFLRLAPRAVTGPASAVPELAALAGHLPLAISLLARVYAKHPSWTLANLTRETRASLLTLAAEKGSVAAAFDVSYRYLPPAQQRLFRRLGLHPGTTIDAHAAAALAGVAEPEAAGLLDALHGEGLLTESGYRRYGMHDLIRHYAKDLAAADDEPGLDSLLDYYQAAAAIAGFRLARSAPVTPVPPAGPAAPATLPSLPDRARALSWARTERANLLACLEHASRTGQQARIVALTAAIAALLRQDGPWADAVTRHVTAVRAARRLGDRAGQANALNNLGVVRILAGDYPGTAEALEGALAIYRDLGDWPGQASALHNLGSVRWRTDDLDAAAATLGRALELHRDLEDRAGQADDLSELSTVLHLTTDYLAAAATLEAALDIHRDLGDWAGQADDLNKLGSLRRQTGDYPAAAAALEAALGIYRDLGDALGQARSLTILGAVRRRTGDYPGAAAALEAALGIHQELGYQLGEAGASYELGAVRLLTGDLAGATDALETALRITRGLGYRSGEVEILNEVGALHRARGDLDRAEASHREALDLARQIGSSWDEGHALAGLGRRALAAGRPGDAAAGLRQAWEIFQRIGAPEAGGLAEEIEALADAG